MMRAYPKIQSVFKRDPDNKYKTFIEGAWSTPEFCYLSELQWEATEKIDGTNMRLEIRTDGYSVGGRTDKAQIPTSLLGHMDEVAGRTTDLAGLTLFGEGYGAGIQKGGGDYRPDQGFILFDVQVTNSGVWLDRANVVDVAWSHGIPWVRVLATTTLSNAIAHMRDYPETITSEEREQLAEGWVLRPAVELNDRLGGRIVTKIKVKDFPEVTP